MMSERDAVYIITANLTFCGAQHAAAQYVLILLDASRDSKWI
jgi:hypothetical protein